MIMNVLYYGFLAALNGYFLPFHQKYSIDFNIDVRTRLEYEMAILQWANLPLNMGIELLK